MLQLFNKALQPILRHLDIFVSEDFILEQKIKSPAFDLASIVNKIPRQNVKNMALFPV